MEQALKEKWTKFYGENKRNHKGWSVEEFILVDDMRKAEVEFGRLYDENCNLKGELEDLYKERTSWIEVNDSNKQNLINYLYDVSDECDE